MVDWYGTIRREFTSRDPVPNENRSVYGSIRYPALVRTNGSTHLWLSRKKTNDSAHCTRSLLIRATSARGGRRKTRRNRGNEKSFETPLYEKSGRMRTASVGLRGTSLLMTLGSVVCSMATGKSEVKNGMSFRSLTRISQVKLPNALVSSLIDVIPTACGYLGSTSIWTRLLSRRSVKVSPPSSVGGVLRLPLLSNCRTVSVTILQNGSE